MRKQYWCHPSSLGNIHQLLPRVILTCFIVCESYVLYITLICNGMVLSLLKSAMNFVCERRAAARAPGSGAAPGGSIVCATQVHARFLSTSFLWVRPTLRVFSPVFTVGLAERRSQHERQSAGRAAGDRRCSPPVRMSEAAATAATTRLGVA